MTESIPRDSIVWDPSIYPRAKWSTATVDRYVDALEAGDQFPPMVVEAGTRRLLDGKHRQLAYLKAELLIEDQPINGFKVFVPAPGKSVPVEARTVPDGMSVKLFAATLSARHGDRMSNADLKALAREEFEADPKLTAAGWGRHLGLPERSVRRWVSDIIDREKRRRQAAVWRLSKLGWTQAEIADSFKVSQPTVAGDIKNGQLADLDNRLPDDWNDNWLVDEAERIGVPLTEAMAAAIGGMSDDDRLARLDIKLQPYDVWQFPSCHDLMGDDHPGRIPGELVAHVLYFFTDPGELVVDPMAGSGTTLDACLLMGRKARGYDIDHRHDRVDVEQHDLSTGWPDTVEKARLIFWDPPYYKKMDGSSAGHGGNDGYIVGSISRLDVDDYLAWFHKRFGELREAVRPGTTFAFLMSDWDGENAKRTEDEHPVWLWDYVDRLRDSGWTMRRHIQCPLSTQQIHPDIVNKFRTSRRLARLERYLLVAEA